MSNPYISSIINKYGDRANVPGDCRIIFDILNRQGTSLLIDCISEAIGSSAIKMNLNALDVALLKTSLLNELKNALDERT